MGHPVDTEYLFILPTTTIYIFQFVTENEQLKKKESVNVVNEDESSVLSKLNEELRILKEKNEELEEEISRLNQNQIDSITDEFSEDLE